MDCICVKQSKVSEELLFAALDPSASRTETKEKRTMRKRETILFGCIMIDVSSNADVGFLNSVVFEI